MLQIRIHGRGGQGVVTAAEMLSIAAFEQGRHAQAFPSFGSERTGAPVVAFCRIDDQEIRLREPIQAPDVLIIVQDPTLLHQVDVFQGLKPDGFVLINSRRSFDDLGLADIEVRFRHERLTTLPATDIAQAPGPAAAQRRTFRWLCGPVRPDHAGGPWPTRLASNFQARWPMPTWPQPPKPLLISSGKWRSWPMLKTD